MCLNKTHAMEILSFGFEIKFSHVKDDDCTNYCIKLKLVCIVVIFDHFGTIKTSV